MDRLFLTAGSVSAGLAVAAGAFGAHALRARLEPRMMEVFETAVRYQMYHAIALLLVGWLATRYPSRTADVAGWLFIAGTLLFSGSLYALVLSGARALGAITPLGGLCFLGGWACIAATVWRSR